MSSKRVWTTLLVLSILGSRFPGVWAQLSTMATCPAGWQWVSFSIEPLRLRPR